MTNFNMRPFKFFEGFIDRIYYIGHIVLTEQELNERVNNLAQRMRRRYERV